MTNITKDNFELVANDIQSTITHMFRLTLQVLTLSATVLNNDNMYYITVNMLQNQNVDFYTVPDYIKDIWFLFDIQEDTYDNTINNTIYFKCEVIPDWLNAIIDVVYENYDNTDIRKSLQDLSDNLNLGKYNI